MTDNTTSTTHPDAVASTSDGNTDAWEAFDSNVGTECRIGAGERLIIDLGREETVTDFALSWRNNGRWASTWRLEWSDDGVVWNTANTVVRPPGANDTNVTITRKLDPRVMSSSVVVNPRGAGTLRLLDFASKALPNTKIVREAAAFAGDEALYGISTTASADPGEFGGVVTVQNESATIPMTFIIGGDQRFTSLVTRQLAAASVTVDFNGLDVRLEDLDFTPATVITAPVGSSLFMDRPDVEAAIISAPLAVLPEIFHAAAGGLRLDSDVVTVAYRQIDAGIGELDTQGNDIDATTGPVFILDGSVDEANLPGTRFSGQDFQVRGVNMSAPAPWFVDSVNPPLAELMVLGNSDASGGATGTTVVVVDGGGNVNWAFPISLIGSGAPKGGLGIGIGIGLARRK